MTKGKVVSLADAGVSIPKPEPSNDLSRYKSKRTASVANVETLQTALPHHSISQAKDFVRLHPMKKPIGRMSCALSASRLKGRSATHCI